MIHAIFQWLASRFARRQKPLDTQQQHPTQEEAEVTDFWNRLRGPGYAPLLEEMTEEEGRLQYGTSHIQMKEYLEGWPGQDD